MASPNFPSIADLADADSACAQGDYGAALRILALLIQQENEAAQNKNGLEISKDGFLKGIQ